MKVIFNDLSKTIENLRNSRNVTEEEAYKIILENECEQVRQNYRENNREPPRSVDDSVLVPPFAAFLVFNIASLYSGLVEKSWQFQGKK